MDIHFLNTTREIFLSEYKRVHRDRLAEEITTGNIGEQYS